MAKSSSSWQKGRSGNPHGRPKREAEVVTILSQRLQRRMRSTTAKVLVCDTLIGLAIGGDVRAIGIILSTMQGSYEFAVRSEILDRIAEIERRLDEVQR